MQHQADNGGAAALERELPRAWGWALAALVGVLATLPFWAAAGYGYVELDDDRNLLAQFNPWFHAGNHALDGERLRWMFTANHYGHYQPLTWLSFALDANLFGFEPQVFHRTNVLLHGVVALLVLRLALVLQAAASGRERASVRQGVGAVFAALAYGLHPLRTESVAWITERRDLLSALFLIGAVLAYVRAVRDPEGRTLWLALTCGLWVLSLFSKAWGITLPAVLLVLDLYPLRRQRGEDGRSLAALAREKLFLLPVALVFAWLAARAQGDTLAVVPWDEHGPLQRAAQAAFGLAFYLWKSLWPAQLSPLYLLEEQLDPLRARYVIGAAVCAGLAASAWLARARLPAWTAALCAYAILVSPVLGFLQSGAQVAADRYTYLAAIPLALAAGAGLAALLARARVPARAGVLALAAAALVGLGLAARAQTRVWRDSIALFGRMVEVEPDNYFALHCLSAMLARDGRLQEAEAHARASIAAHPRRGNVEARYNLAIVLARLGRDDEVDTVLREALAVDPTHLNSLRMFVARRAADGRPDEVQAAWRAALAADPAHAQANHVLGAALLAEGRTAEAEPMLVRAVGGAPGDPEPLVDLARVYQAQGRSDEARNCARHALLLSPGHARARALLTALGG
jgi:Flp pilus assembly protein TadD